ncbi:MAG: ABC transporter substrate-binding protein [Planctomycetia bacterium]
MRRLARALARCLGLGALALLAACGAPEAGPAGQDGSRAADGSAHLPYARLEVQAGRRSVRFDDGTRCVLPAATRRIASTLPNLTELVAHLGGVERLVGVSPHCNFPPGLERLPRVSVMPLDLEGLRALAPDLVLCDRVFHAASLEALGRAGVPWLALQSRSLDDLEDTVQLLGAVLEEEPAAQAARAPAESPAARAAALVARLRAARERVRPPAGAVGPAVLVVGQADPLHVLGPGSLLDDMLRACGARNVAADLGRPSGPFSEEALLARAPGWILTTWGALPEAQRQRWARVPALAQGHVAEAVADDLLRAGPRTPQALERLGEVLAGRLPPAALAGGR